MLRLLTTVARQHNPGAVQLAVEAYVKDLGHSTELDKAVFAAFCDGGCQCALSVLPLAQR